MTTFEIALAQAYLAKSRQDPIAALIRSVRDLARLRQILSARQTMELGVDGKRARVRDAEPALGLAA